MINLLPQKAKKRIIREYYTRAISVWFLIFSAVVAIVSFLFLPVYILVSSQVEAFSKSISEASEKVREYDFSSQALTKATKDAQLIYEMEASQKITDLLSILSNFQNENLLVREYDFKRNGKNIEVVRLSGLAKTRQALVDFSEKLKKLDFVEVVDLPVSNLAKDRDLEFSLNLKLKEIKK